MQQQQKQKLQVILQFHCIPTKDIFFYSEVISAAQDCAIYYLYQLVFYLCIIQTKPQLQGRDPQIKMLLIHLQHRGRV